MLRALLERGVVPELVVGTSVGAINGAAVAADPTPAAAARLERLWGEMEAGDVFGGSSLGRLATLARSRTHLHGNERLRALLDGSLPARFEDLRVPFECVAASIERAAERWFGSGALGGPGAGPPPGAG